MKFDIRVLTRKTSFTNTDYHIPPTEVVMHKYKGL